MLGCVVVYNPDDAVSFDPHPKDFADHILRGVARAHDEDTLHAFGGYGA